LGAYVCSSTPGEYIWQPGPLYQVCFRLSSILRDLVGFLSIAKSDTFATNF
jgi:hypothetical protein